MATGILNLPYTMSPVSPFDVITSQAENERIANIESLADGTGIGDNAITADKTAFGGNYSTSEVNTGFKWIDGKTIYKKTLSVGPLPNNTFKNVTHNVTGIDLGISVSGIASDGANMLPLPYVAATSTGEVLCNFSKTNVTVVTNSDRSGFTLAYVTITYTKV